MNLKKILLNSVFVVAFFAGAAAVDLSVAYLINQYKPYIPSSSSMVERVEPSVVNIEVEFKKIDEEYSENSYDQEMDKVFPSKPQPHYKYGGGIGTGFIISEDGTIVTATHVVKDASKITLKMYNGKKYQAHILFEDDDGDISILRFDDEIHNLPFVNLGDSDKLQQGDPVVAIGSPFGFEFSVSKGIVSYLNRNSPDNLKKFIQTDTSINRGNSGGPLFNVNGEVIGVNDEIISQKGESDGVALSIPSNVVKTYIEKFKEDGKINRGKVGIKYTIADDLIKATLGLYDDGKIVIVEVIENSPADGKFKEGDEIYGASWTEEKLSKSIFFKNKDELQEFIYNHPQVDVNFIVFRDGRTIEVKIKLAIK